MIPWLRSMLHQRLIILILLLSIIPVLGFGTTMYVIGVRLIESEVERSSRASITQLKEQVDLLVSQIEQLSGQLSIQSGVVEWMNVGAQPPLGTLPQMNALLRDLSSFAGSIRALHSVYLYHIAQRTVLTSSSLMTSIDNPAQGFEDFGWLEGVDESIVKGERNRWMASRQLSDKKNQPTRVLTYIKLLPFFNESAHAALAVNVDTRYMTELVRSFPMNTSGSVYIFSRAGELIADAGSAAQPDPAELRELAALGDDQRARDGSVRYTLGERSVYATVERSGQNGWLYVMVIPVDQPARNVLLLKRMVLVATCVLSALALVMSFFSFNRFQTGLRRIGQALFGREQPERTEAMLAMPYRENVRRIEKGIAHLHSEVDEVRSQWQAQLPLLRDHYLYSALLGNSAAVRLRARLADGGDFALFAEPAFVALVVQMDEASEATRFGKQDEALFLFAAENICGELMRDVHTVETVSTLQYAIVIVNLPERATDGDTIRIAERCRETIHQFLKQTVTIGVGRMVPSFEELSVSYHDAIQALQLNWLKAGNEVLHYRTLYAREDWNPVYPKEASLAIIENIRFGREDEAAAELGRFSRKLEADGIGFGLMKSYYVQLLVSMLLELQEYDQQLGQSFLERSPYTELLRLDSRQAIHAWFMTEMIGPMIATLEQAKRSQTDERIATILAFVEQRYVQDLSLQWIADYFQVSPSYISRLFKEKTGETFMQYITRYRVEQVKRLMHTTELTIAQIAGEVGYTNAQQLIRMFKKLEGMTPGEYRSQSQPM